MRYVWSVVVALSVFATTQLAAQTSSDLRLEVGVSGLTARNVTVGGEVVWFGRSVTYSGGIPRLSRHFLVSRDDDRNGTVLWKLKDVPALSVWTAVDFSSGSFAVAAPSGTDIRLLDLPQFVWRGGIAEADISRDYIDVLLVRPRVGVWTLRAFQGGRFDADRQNDATLRSRLDMMEAQPGSPPPPATATPRDVLVIIDPRALDVLAKSAQ